MAEEPLAIGVGVLIIGILWWIAGPMVYELINVHTRGWAFLLIIIGLAVIVVRLENMLS